VLAITTTESAGALFEADRVVGGFDEVDPRALS
jgi:hypothetical protein